MIEKYNNLAREALSNGDKILSENYFQHADHFTRILNEQESFKKSKFQENITSSIKENTQNNLDKKASDILDNQEDKSFENKAEPTIVK